jgi:Protein of unknown function (DUF1501)
MLHKTCQDLQLRPEDYLNTRRQFIGRLGLGFGTLSLTSLVGMGLLPALDAGAVVEPDSYSPLAPRRPHFAPKAKRVIHIFASGAPSHLDTWDPKPELDKYDGKSMPDDASGRITAFASPFKFQKCGKSGIEVSEVFPLIGQHIDDLAVVRSMWTDIPDHSAATVMMNTGSLRLIKPSVGSWVTYGLGTENQNLPGFISLAPGGTGAENLRSAFLPGAYQGTSVNTGETRLEKLIENIKNQYTSLPEQRKQLDLLHQLNEVHAQNLKKDGALEARLQNYELAYQMQMEASDAFDISKEPKATQELYGTNTAQGRQMLIARRLLEKGVRFVQAWHGGWDHHNNLERAMTQRAGECDKPIAALLTDLKQKGMLKDTLVIWGGEFGRSPSADGNATGGTPGRNHNGKAFSIWMAGGGIKGGQAYGATDELGGKAVENKVHIHDLHATMLQLLGFNHEKLTYRYNGRDFRLTDVYGNVVKQLIA